MPKMANCSLLFLISATLIQLSITSKNSCITNSDCPSHLNSLCHQNECTPCFETNHCTHISSNAKCIIAATNYCELPCLSDQDCQLTAGFCLSGICQSCKVNSDCDSSLSCLSIGNLRKCGNCINDIHCQPNEVCRDNVCSIVANRAITRESEENFGIRNLQVTAAVYTDSEYTTISIIMIAIYAFFVLVGGVIMMYCEDDSSFLFRQYNLIQALVSVLFINVNYGSSVGFTTLLSVLNVASSFTWLPNIFSLFIDYDYTRYKFYPNFAVYGMTGLFLRDLGGLLWGLLFTAIFQGIAELSKPSSPPFSKFFNMIGLKTAAKLLLFGSYQIVQVSMLQLINATFEGGVQIVSWVLAFLFFTGYFGIICYLAYLEWKIYPITSAAFKASKRENMKFVYDDLRPNEPEKIKPMLLALITKNFFTGFLLVVTYEVEYLQIILQLILGLAYTGLVGFYKPFRTNLIFGIEIVGELGVALTRLLVLIYQGTKSTSIISGMDLIIWVLLATGFVYSVYQPIRVLIKRFKGKGDPSLNNPTQFLNTIKNNQVTPAGKPDNSTNSLKKQPTGVPTEMGINDSSLYTEQPSGLARGLSPTNKGKPGDKLEVQNLDKENPLVKQTTLKDSILDTEAMSRVDPNPNPAPILRQTTFRESTDKSVGFKKAEENNSSNLSSPRTSTLPANKLFNRQPTLNGVSNGETAVRESIARDGVPPLSKRDINLNSNFNSIATPQNGISENKPDEPRFSFQKKEPERIPEESPQPEFPLRVGINQFLQDPKLNLDRAKKSFPSLEKPQKSQAILEKPSPNITDNTNTPPLKQPEVTPFNSKFTNFNDNSYLDDSNNRSFNDSVSIPLNRNKNDKFINIADLPNEPILPKYFNNENQINTNERSPPPDRTPTINNKGLTLERKPYPPEPINITNTPNNIRPQPIVSQSQNYNRDIIGRDMKPPEKVNIGDLIQNLRNKQAQTRQQPTETTNGASNINYRNLSTGDKESYGYDRYAPKSPAKANQVQVNNTEEFSTLDPQRYLDPRQPINDPYREPQVRGRQINQTEDPYAPNQTSSSGRPIPLNFSRKESNYSELEPKYLPNQVRGGSVNESRHMSHVSDYEHQDPYKIDPYKVTGQAYTNPYSSQTENFRSQSQPQNIKKGPPPSNSESDYELIQQPMGINLQGDDSVNYRQPPNFRNPQGNVSNPGRLKNIQDEYNNPTLGQDRYISVPVDKKIMDPYAYGDRMVASNYRNSSPDDLERSSEDMSSVNMRLYANQNAKGDLSPQARQHEKARLQNALKNLDDIKAWINAKNQVRTPTSDSKRNTYGDNFRTSKNQYY